MGAKLNLDFYGGQDYYSDGDIEDELLLAPTVSVVAL